MSKPSSNGMKLLKISFEDIITRGYTVWTPLTYTAINIGKWLGLAPTGKKTTLKDIDVFCGVNGKLAE